MGLNLWQIDERLRMLEDYMMDIETGECLSDEDFAKKFDEVQMALSDKIENTSCFIKSLNAEIECYKAEENNIAKRRKVKENLANRLKQNIDRYIRCQFTDEDGNINLESLSKYKFETPKVRLSYRKSNTLNITDLDKIPEKYIKPRVIKESDVDKTTIKKEIKNNKISGVVLTTNINMQVK